MAQFAKICFLFLLIVIISCFSRGNALDNSTTNIISTTNQTSPVVSKVTKEETTKATTQPSPNSHKGREHVISAPEHVISAPVKTLNVTSVNTTSEVVVSKNVSQPLNVTVNTTPKVNNSSTQLKTNHTSSTTKATTTSTTIKPKKPLLTEHDEVVAAPAKPNLDIPTLAHIDTTMEKKVRRADYVVPIVAVILSVPLVAVILSVFYKKGKDWWQHRNYRRMDYLIEGMYNS
ncbi:unnamed protein product [Diabrotica balteata]|uniref:Uncharacterized protein n=1 Tax=Diabrotica balteata TaxID=107213 RepID=A0A9N9T1L9_DIABA|nr:unnamed protein product [Diabrotica balteata]